MATLEQRISALEARISPEGEAVVPTYLTVNPTTGVVTAIFSGGVQMPEAGAVPIAPTSALSWTDTTTGVVRSYVQGFATAGILHTLSILANPDTNNFGRINLSARIAANATAGSAAVAVSAKDSVNNVTVQASVLNSNGQSDFMFGSPSAVSSPVNTFGIGRIPNTLHPTLVYMSFLLSTVGGGSLDSVSVFVNGNTVQTVYFREFGVIPGGLADMETSVCFLVPTGQQYFAQINASSGAAGYPVLNSTTELTL